MPRLQLIAPHSRKAWRLFGIALIALACLALVSLSFGQQTFVGVHGRLSVKGNQIVDQNGNPTTLHGMSLYCWSAQGKQFFNAIAINHLARDWRCTVIRIAVLPRDYKNNPDDEIARVKTVIDACIANGIYAIVDWHSMQGAQNDVPTAQSFFATLAAAYGKTPNIMYEPWNEPVQESWDVIKAYHEALIGKIRVDDPNNIIIVGSRHWDQELDEASQNPIKSSPNIAYSIHFYAATHRQPLRDNGARALKNGVALFASEYGAKLGFRRRRLRPGGNATMVELAGRESHRFRKLVGRGPERNVRRISTGRQRDRSLDR